MGAAAGVTACNTCTMAVTASKAAAAERPTAWGRGSGLGAAAGSHRQTNSRHASPNQGTAVRHLLLTQQPSHCNVEHAATNGPV